MEALFLRLFELESERFSPLIINEFALALPLLFGFRNIEIVISVFLIEVKKNPRMLLLEHSIEIILTSLELFILREMVKNISHGESNKKDYIMHARAPLMLALITFAIGKHFEMDDEVYFYKEIFLLVAAHYFVNYFVPLQIEPSIILVVALVVVEHVDYRFETNTQLFGLILFIGDLLFYYAKRSVGIITYLVLSKGNMHCYYCHKTIFSDTYCFSLPCGHTYHEHCYHLAGEKCYACMKNRIENPEEQKKIDEHLEHNNSISAYDILNKIADTLIEADKNQ